MLAKAGTIDSYVSTRKPRGGEGIMIAHPKKADYFDKLSKDSGVALPSVWDIRVPVMCEACFAQHVSELRMKT